MSVSDYNTDPDLNTSISGINIAEGCPPSGINNAIRQMMADIKAQVDTDGTTYLPLSGGNMTGGIAVTGGSSTAFQQTHTNGTSLRFGIGSGGDNRGIYQGTGNNHYEGWLLYWDANGAFWLRSENNGATGKVLAGNPTGNLTWGGTAISLNGHTHNYLPLSGGTLTGAIIDGNASEANPIIRSADNNGRVIILGGSSTSASAGAKCILHGSGDSDVPGGFVLQAGTSSGYRQLVGNPTGTLTWNGQPIQTSSDERLKTAFSEVPDEILDAWGKVNWQQFKFIEDAERKGIDNCRWHPGLVAQRVKAVFEAEGLDACAYGILCHEEWDAEYDGEIIIREAGEQWFIRYEEALAMEAIYQRRRADRLEERIARLEALLDGDMK